MAAATKLEPRLHYGLTTFDNEIPPAVLDDAGNLQMSQDQHDELVRSLHLQMRINGLSRQDAEDCIQKAVIALLGKVTQLEPGPIGGWLMRAAKFEAKHLIRDRTRARVSPLETLTPTVDCSRAERSAESLFDHLAARIALSEAQKMGRALTPDELVRLGVIDEVPDSKRRRSERGRQALARKGERTRLRRLAQYRGFKLIPPSLGGWQILDAESEKAVVDPALLTDHYSIEQWLFAQPTTGENVGEQNRPRRRIADASGLSLELVKKMSPSERDEMARSLGVAV